jgi:hypothetical protein
MLHLRRTLCFLPVVLPAFLFCSCADHMQELVKQTQATDKNSTSTTPQGDQAETDPQPGASRPAENPANNNSSALDSPIANEPPAVAADDQPNNETVIQLSAGVQLPQSLPQGTVITFSAEYQFVNRGPNPNVQYVWVIEGGGKKERVGIPGLAMRGQLPALFSRVFKPGDEPYSSYIEEWPRSNNRNRQATGKRISNVISLR